MGDAKRTHSCRPSPCHAAAGFKAEWTHHWYPPVQAGDFSNGLLLSEDLMRAAVTSTQRIQNLQVRPASSPLTSAQSGQQPPKC
jgi:hypothetical protein